jgi:sulfite exporter TauE/SafE
VFALVAVGFLALLLRPLRSLVPDVSAGASFGALLAFGAVASVSTCLASTGGFLLAYHGKAPGRSRRLFVHIGRLVAFSVGGAVLGALGGSIPAFSEGAYGVLALALGIGFLLVGLSLLDLVPSPATLGLVLPARFQELGNRVSRSNSRLAPFAVGAVTFVLPCGFTQTAQALALASGSALQGAMLMSAFALGTLPVLAGISSFGSARFTAFRPLRLAAGALLLFFAFGQVDGGLTVLGSPVTPGSVFAAVTTRAGDTIVPAAHAEEQVVRMTVAYGTYEPKRLVIRKGVPVRWEIDGKDIAGCASSMVVPSLGISRTLAPGQNVIRFIPPAAAGSVPFSCGMGMIRGSFTVTD